MDLLALVLTAKIATSVDSGPLSVYRPNDGHNKGDLACGGKFDHIQRHIAYRRWKHIGCGTAVLVVSKETKRAVLASVQDAGPFGIVDVATGKRWKIWTKSLKAPEGWRFRGAVDLSWGLWIALGRPQFLSKVELHFLPKDWYKRAKGLIKQNESESRYLEALIAPQRSFPDSEEHAAEEWTPSWS